MPKPASPLSPVIARIRAAGATVGHQPHHDPNARGPYGRLAYVVTGPDGTRWHVQTTSADWRNALDQLTRIADQIGA